jgi:hypothetical protein
MAARATRYVSQWATPASGAEFSRQAFLNMLEGKVPFLRKPGFVSRQVAQRVENVMVPQLAPYLHKTGPALRKVGVAQFEFQAQSEADLANRRDDGRFCHFFNTGVTLERIGTQLLLLWFSNHTVSLH